MTNSPNSEDAPGIMKIAIGADHAGVEVKDAIVAQLQEAGHDVVDAGTNGGDSVDYPDFANPVAAAVSQGEAERGILVCGTGIGMSMAANKHAGVRAAVVTDAFTCEATRQHNDANVLCLGARVVDAATIPDLVRIFLDTPFEGGRHERRVAKIEPPARG
ncbi:MAG: ribose 5-phosphate isomerase B [Planctomycetota bacterium]